jgi:hypothetical protein
MDLKACDGAQHGPMCWLLRSAPAIARPQQPTGQLEQLSSSALSQHSSCSPSQQRHGHGARYVCWLCAGLRGHACHTAAMCMYAASPLSAVLQTSSAMTLHVAYCQDQVPPALHRLWHQASGPHAGLRTTPHLSNIQQPVPAVTLCCFCGGASGQSELKSKPQWLPQLTQLAASLTCNPRCRSQTRPSHPPTC